MTDTDLAYANAAFIPGAEGFPPRWAAAAAAFRTALGARAETGLAHGPGPRQTLDLFHPEGAPRGLAVFVHGGFWRDCAPADWSHLAAGPLARGWAVAMPGYTLAPAARIAAITREVSRAIDAAAARVAGPIVLAGHSAGGHLAARMLCADAAPAAAGRIARTLAISPLADLRPLLAASALNAVLRLDPAEAEAESPVCHRPATGVDLVTWVGGDERPAFLDQARWLHDAWGGRLVIEPGRHHFDVIEGLEAAESPLCRALLAGL
ncbi:MAG: alpha/beta hydrolase [Rhodobacteraceae bacterium]|nr:alpha/beta hydrolase [Paracoccaceae bacterium]